ncbi:hypothetical protein GGQ74_002560 [Desulfobaculum xiamenense]|uniref:Glycosyltransferase RgtA/B/C/D-like domain-containing protein n=1 Tax=Desulfobaculum xiamenense TaxID=995050 RepID=A0A846QNX8_9BACT|nr:glycosyltransferase family 39 protein [Desulfobaculum xiamenense]NJB68887.1 hypothetical protein [Desulfobaculum xiamenense]
MAGVLILFTTLARVAFVLSGQLDLVQDEAQYWDWSRTFQLSYFTKGPLIAWIIGGGTAIFGDTPLGVRFGAIAGAALTQIIVYLGIARLWGRPRLAFLSLVVLNCSLLAMASGILMTTDNPLLVCWYGALFSLYWASREPERHLPYVLLALTLCVGTLAKYMMLAFVPTVIVYVWLLRRKGLCEPMLVRRLAVACLVGTVGGLVPIVNWNLQNDFAGLRHVLHLGGMAGSRAETFLRLDKFPEYIGSQIGLLLPWWFLYMMFGAVAVVRSLADAPGRGVRSVEGLGYRQKALLAAGFWPIWGFFILWSFHTKINPNWSAVSYASGFILAAAAWDAVWRRRGWRNWRVWPWPFVGLALMGMLMLHDTFPLPWRYDGRLPMVGEVHIENPILHLKGWDDLGRKVDELRRTRFENPDNVFFFGDNYDVTAALSWNVPGKERAFCLPGGRRLNQYDLWPGPEGREGWDAIFVRKKFSGPRDSLLERFARYETIQYQSQHGDRPARRFTIYLCYGFSGQWPPAQGTDY